MALQLATTVKNQSLCDIIGQVYFKYFEIINFFRRNSDYGGEENLKRGLKPATRIRTHCLTLQLTNNTQPHHSQIYFPSVVTLPLPPFPSLGNTPHRFRAVIPVAMRSLFNGLIVIVEDQCTSIHKVVKTIMMMLKYSKLTYRFFFYFGFGSC